jgi:CheY-like chemotaxis protein
VIRRILIIDDDQQFRKMLRRTLESEGFEVLEACDGKEGVQRFSKAPADLIITDMVMPGLGGIETILDIKATCPEAKFIAVSGADGYVSEIEFDMADTLGARTLNKPFGRKEILKMIAELQH